MKTNYTFEKRQKELAKQKKKAEKEQKKSGAVQVEPASVRDVFPQIKQEPKA